MSKPTLAIEPDTSEPGRGARLREIRAAMQLTQPQFAERLTEAAAKLGIDRTYTFVDVSTRETGRRAMDIEDYALASYVDPAERSWFWLAFGRELPHPNMMPRTNKAGRREAK